jgi:hypothetical protein
MIGQSRTRLLGVTVLVVVFAVGGLTGAVVQRSALADNPQPRPQQRGPGLFETLKLSDAQQKQVCTIMKRQADEVKPHEMAIDSARRKHIPVLRAIVEATNANIDSVLTAEQRATKDRFRAERQKFFEQRQAQEKTQKQTDAKERRSARPGPGNPLGIICPGLNDRDGAPHNGGSRSDMPWGGDSSRGDRGANPAVTPAPAPKTEHQS